MSIKYHVMRTNNDCGIVALANITGKTYEEIRDIGWQGKFRGNDDDSIWHHEIALHNLNLHMKPISKEEFLSGNFKLYKTALMMLADDTSPWSYHWFAVLADEKRGVGVLDGVKPYPRLITWERIASGWGKLACAYSIEDGAVEVEWYKRAYVWLTGLMKFRLWG